MPCSYFKRHCRFGLFIQPPPSLVQCFYCTPIKKAGTFLKAFTGTAKPVILFCAAPPFFFSCAWAITRKGWRGKALPQHLPPRFPAFSQPKKKQVYSRC